MIQLKPLHDQFIVEEMDVDDTSDRKIQLLQKTHPVQKGKVIAVSDGYYRRDNDEHMTELPVKVNDVVLFPSKSGFAYDSNNPKRILLKVQHILGIVQ